MQIFSSFVSSTATFAELSLQAAKAPVDTLTGWSLEDRDPQVIEKFVPLLDWFYHHYFRVKTDGWENIPPSGQVLFIGSHNGGLAAPDMFMMMYDWFQRFGSDRLVYGLMDSRVWRVFPSQAHLVAQMGAIHAHPKMAIAALNSGASVLIYPGGATDVFRPHSLRNPYRNLKSENFQDYAQKPHRNCTFINLASIGKWMGACWFLESTQNNGGVPP